MSTQQFLKLTTGPVPTSLIAAVHLDTWDVQGRRRAVALWLKEEAMPLYFPYGSLDDAAIVAWAQRCHNDPAFLTARPYVFATDAITHTDLGWDRDLPMLRVHMTGATPLFALPRESEAADAVRCWYPDIDEATEPRTKVLAAVS